MEHRAPVDMLRFYGGDIRERTDDGKVAFGKSSKDTLWGDNEAYRTLNALLFDGYENEKERIFKEKKKLKPVFIERLDETLAIYIGVFSMMCLQKEKNISAVKVKRVDRQASLNAYQKSFTGSFVACTKGAYDTEFAEKNNVILLEVEIPKESPSVDFQQFLSGNEYSNYIEQEVLLPPFLPLEIEEKPLNLKEKKIRDMHKKPPVGKYLLRTGNFPDYRNEITASKDELYERLMRDKEEAAACLQSMNEGNWEDEYQNYIKWKEDLHNYLKLVYSDLWYGENTNE